ncbi:MAG TPA: tetratricopeptide repeat protein [Sediminispirochaeta sp.]|nr:tetratricopeptide repeat protein [Sediminispirochaeta sp.]
MDEITIEHQIDQILNQVQGRISEGLFTEAEEELEKALEIDFEHAEVLAGLKCCKFWKERLPRLNGFGDDFEKGEYLLAQWSVFKDFLRRIDTPIERELHGLRHWVFGSALVHYQRVVQHEEEPDADLVLRIGRCYKSIGDFEKALEYLENAGRKRREDPEFLAEMADSYALINETKAAKAFFREAFFINPSKVRLEYLESELITRLIARVRDFGYADQVVREWIPVYGVLLGVFNIKRELRPLEYGKLKQSIYSLERRLQEDADEAEWETLVPRLLNRYFWLIDHYVNAHENRERVEEILYKIKSTDENIYEQYIN